MKKILARRLFLVFLVALLVLALPGVALADELVVDGDPSTPGTQTVVNLTVDPGKPAITSANVAIAWRGDNYLPDGTDVVVAVDRQNTTLPGDDYVVTGATLKIPMLWDGSQPVYYVSRIGFTAPSDPGVYRYTVKWKVEADYGAGLTGNPSLQIILTVPGVGSAAQYTVAPLYDVGKAQAGNFPIKIQLQNGSANVSSSSLTVKAEELLDAEEVLVREAASTGKANSGGLFRYDEELKGYIFNLDTEGLLAGNYTLTFLVGDDDTPYSVPFALK